MGSHNLASIAGCSPGVIAMSFTRLCVSFLLFWVGVCIFLSPLLSAPIGTAPLLGSTCAWAAAVWLVGWAVMPRD